MKITQKDIANQLNLSRATVTKALQDHPDIALETSNMIKQFAKEIGYIPNGIGRSLVTEKTYTIGVIIPKIADSFYSASMEHMYASATRLGYRVFLMISFEDERQQTSDIETLLSMNVDGIIIDPASTTFNKASLDVIKKRKVPLMFFDRRLLGYKGNGVIFDNYDLSYRLTQQLIDKGYKDYLYLSGPQHINISHDRFKGFKDALENRGVPFNEKLLAKNDSFGQEEGKESFVQYYKQAKHKPKVVVCTNDSLALGVYDACQDLKLRIPKDLGVVGFGGLTVANLVNPSLTTVELPVKEAISKSIANLVSLIENAETEIIDEVFPGKIIFRKSTKSLI
ncbi:MAG: LacI family DNA-binding transcriptional regulator [Cyclobacteriaceae bacterium]